MPLYEVINLIKECDVILHNNKVAVILFEGRKIQIPHSELIRDKAYIKFESDKYAVVSIEDFEKEKTNSKQRAKKSPHKGLDSENKDLIGMIDNEERGYNSL